MQASLFQIEPPKRVGDGRNDPSGKLGNTRVTGKEQFYTPPNIVGRVLDLVQGVHPNWVEAPFLEPAGGTGTFIETARARGCGELHSWDIEPLHPDVVKGDFLLQSLGFRGAVCATNPPFGRNNALSIPFFNHAAPACDVIAFIVPRSWRKWSVVNRLDRDFRLAEDHDLKINYLDANGKDVQAFDKLRTCIQVWTRYEGRRPRYSVEDRGLVRRVGPEEADAALTIFGFSCGKVTTDFPRKKVTTQMYLKLQHPRALEALENVDFSQFFLNTAYTEALSIHEVNYLLNEYIFEDAGLVESL